MARSGAYTAIGSTGLDTSSGLIREDFLRELVGDRGRRVIREMTDQDPVIGAILFAIEMLVRQVEWGFNPADDSEEAAEIAEFVDGCLHDMSSSWEDTLAEILSFLPYGWSWSEIVYKQRLGEDGDPASRYDDQRIGWRKFAPRPQDTLHKWKFDAEGGVQAMIQLPAPDFKEREIPIDRSLLFRTSIAKGNPEGRSILRPAYRPWYFKKHIENIEGVGLERDLAGLPIAYVPQSIMREGATTDEKKILNAIRDIVKNIKRDEQEGLVLPLMYDDRGNQLYKLELLSTGGSRQFDTDKIINRYDSRIAMVVLADFILLGQQNVGSWALSSDKTELFAVALRTILAHIKGVLNAHAIPRLMRLNGIKRELWPEIDFGDIERTNLGVLGAYLQSLTAAGMTLFPNPDLEQHVMEQAGLPAPLEATEEDADVVPDPDEIDPDDEPTDAEVDDAEEEIGQQKASEWNDPDPLPFAETRRRKKPVTMRKDPESGEWKPVGRKAAARPAGGTDESDKAA